MKNPWNQTLLTRLEQLIPAKISHPEERSRGIVLLAVCFMTLSIGFLFLMLHVSGMSNLAPFTALVNMMMMMLVPLVMGLTQRYQPAAMTMVVVAVISVSFAAIQEGGLASDSIFWLVLLPSICMVLFQRLGGLIGFSALIISVAAVVVGDMLGWSDLTANTEFQPPYRFLMVLSVALVSTTLALMREAILTRVRAVVEQSDKKRIAAEARSQAQAAFLATISHEIRTPLNGVLGLATVLENTPLSNQQQAHVRAIRQSGELLMRLLNDVLDTARIEAGTVELRLEPVDPDELIKSVVSLFQRVATKRGLSLQYRTEGSLPEGLMLDANRIRQIVLNLINNALKFSDEGQILVMQRYVEGFWEVSVQDSGPGISADRLKQIFTPFFKCQAASFDALGTGLGLFICRQLAEVHGGDLQGVSTIGVGSTFTLSLPTETCALSAETRQPLVQTPSRPLRILVAEDNLISQSLIRALLEREGHEVIVVIDGEEAIKAVKETHFDAVLMDLRMPRLDGLKATREIRKQVPALPVIALTANVFAEDEIAAYEAGVQAFLTKPVEIEALLHALAYNSL